MFENYKVFETELAGRPLWVETGKVAGLANGSCMIHYGDTVILCCATASAAYAGTFATAIPSSFAASRST